MATRLHIKICEAKNLIKKDINPYVTMRLKNQDKLNFQKTQVIINNCNPVWNEEFDIIVVDPNDTLLINMYDQDGKKDDKLMDELEFPVKIWPIDGPLEKDVIDIKLKKKKDAGKIIFQVQAFPADIGTELSATSVDQQPQQTTEQPQSQQLNEQQKQQEIVEQPQQTIEQPVQQETNEKVENIEEEPVPAPVQEQTKDIPPVQDEVTNPPSSVQPCKVVVKAVKGENLLKLDENGSNPYVTFMIKGDENSVQTTKAIDDNLNPVWEQSFQFDCKDRNTDVLLVNLYDKDMTVDDKMMNELEFPLKEWKIGTHIEYNQDIKLDKKKAGQLYLEFDVLDENGGGKVDTREIIFDVSKEIPEEKMNDQEDKKLEEVEEEVEDEVDQRPVQKESISGTIINACGIPKTNSNGSDTYVLVTVYSQDDKDKKVGKIKTSVHSNTQDPVWNKEFELPEAKRGDTMKAEIFQTRKIMGDKCIASVNFVLKGLKNNEPVKKTFRLEKPDKGRSVKNGNDYGTLTLSLTRNVQFV